MEIRPVCITTRCRQLFCYQAIRAQLSSCGGQAVIANTGFAEHHGLLWQRQLPNLEVQPSVVSLKCRPKVTNLHHRGKWSLLCYQQQAPKPFRKPRKKPMSPYCRLSTPWPPSRGPTAPTLEVACRFLIRKKHRKILILQVIRAPITPPDEPGIFRINLFGPKVPLQKTS